MKKLMLIIVLCSITFNSSATEKLNDSTKKKKVYLFAGQSNMDGRANGGVLSNKDLERLAKVGHRILFYYNHKPVTPLQLTTPTPFLHNKFKFNKIFGPELFFGIELAEKYPNEEFIFIKRSVGGTSLYGCWNPDWTYEKANQMDEAKKPKLYSDFIEYTHSILAPMNESEYEISGMLWIQGEADSNIKNYGEEPAITYGKNLKKLVESVRADLETPNLMFVMFQVGKGKVIEGMQEVAKNDDKVYLIPQSTNETSADYYDQYPKPLGHYTTKSMKRIGVEFFKVYEMISLNK